MKEAEGEVKVEWLRPFSTACWTIDDPHLWEN